VTTDSHKVFEILARENSRMLMVYLRSVVRDQATVDDLFQETLVVAWRRLDECDQSRPFGPWLRGIARRLVLAHYRKMKQSPIVLDEAVLSALDRHFERVNLLAGDTWDEKLEALQECVEALSGHHKTIIHSRYQNGLKLKALAQQMEISIEACKKRLQRARGLVAECLKRKGVLSRSEGAS